ncbi:hypothetical protein DJ031_06835 [bacterium endosymbiont of Escarpia laminata]|nr:MAG: hypothetical protein DJ031_06835 [bacterium endosymbiont of Escarpia laminata]
MSEDTEDYKSEAGRREASDVERLVSSCRTLEIDHMPDGWPAIKMRDVSALCDAVESVVPGIDRLEDRLLAGCEITRQDSRWYLYDRSGEYVTSGDTLRKMIINVVFSDC